MQAQLRTLLVHTPAALDFRTPRFARTAVTLATVALTLAALGYVARFASPLPVADEWDILAEAEDGRPLWRFVTERHNEHRFMISKLFWYGLARAANYDLRVPAAATVLVLAATSLAITALLHRLRGRASLADLLVPALLLNWGHYLNLLMSYQLAVALVPAFAAGILWQVGRSNEPGRELRCGFIAGLWLALLCVQSGYGLAHVPPVALWLGYLAWQAGGARVAIILALPTALLGFVAWHFATLPPAEAAAKPTPGQAAAAAVQFFAISLGDGVTGGTWKVVGAVAILLHLLAAVFAFRAAWRDPAERPRALGLALLIAAQFAVAAGVALSRGSALTPRYATPAATGWLACATVAVLYGPRLPRLALHAGWLAAAALVAVNVAPANAYGRTHRAPLRECELNIRAGWPVAFVAGKHAYSGVGSGPHFRDRLEDARAKGRGVAGLTRPDPPMHAIPVTLAAAELAACDNAPFAPNAPPPPAVLIPPPGRPVLGLRLVVDQPHVCNWLTVKLKWTGADGAVRSQVGYPPWVPRSQVVMTFYLDGDAPQNVRLEAGCPTRGMTIRSTEWLIAE